MISNLEMLTGVPVGVGSLDKIKFRTYLDEVCAAPLMAIVASYLEPYECFVIGEEVWVQNGIFRSKWYSS